MEDYRTVRGTATGEYEEKKSRFIAQLSFADSEEAAVAFLEQVRTANRTARHNVYAYRLRAGNRERYSDDGEPQKTAGLPTLQTLQHAGLTDIACVVTRYFGGTLLGTGGLVRAYTQATQSAIAKSKRVTVSVCIDITLRIAYPLYDQTVRIAAECNAKTLDTQYADTVTLTLRMLDGTQESFLTKVTELCHGQEDIDISKPLNAIF